MKLTKAKEAKGLRLILGYFGLFMIVEGLVTIFPLAILAFYPSEWQCYLDFIVPGAGYIALGFLLYLFTTAFRKKGRLEKNEDSLLLILLWISALVIGAFPFYLTNIPQLNFNNPDISLGMSYTESFFESTSGYSATGLTVFPTKGFLIGVDSSEYAWAHVFLFHRAIMQFVGGVGLVLIVASVISSKNNFKLFFAEGHNDRLLPNLGKNAKLIFSIYFGWILVGSLALWLAGMTPFDAFCHATAAMATGGFGTRSNSILFYSTEEYTSLPNGNLLYTGNGLAIELITVVLMLAGATNFVLHTFLLTGKIKSFSKDIEIKTATFLIVVATILTAVMTYSEHTYFLSSDLPTINGSHDISFWMSLRYNFYNVVSSITTTGFTNYASLKSLGHFSIFVCLILMSIGGGMGSTSGGLKQFRFGILAKEFSSSFRFKNSSAIQTHTVSYVRCGQVKEIDNESVSEASNFLVLYMGFILLGGFALLCLRNVDLEESLYEWGTSLSGTGITIIDFVEYKGENGLAHYNALLWLLDVAMFLGRLEILPAFYGLRRIFIAPFEEIAKKRQKRKIMKNLLEE